MIQVCDLSGVTPELIEKWAGEVAASMREQDREEVAASSGLSPLESIRTSLSLSTDAYCVLDREGCPVTMFGAAPHALPGVGIGWLLGTDGMLREALPIARQSVRFMDEIQKRYWLLWNYIDARNTVSMRWLRWAGFEFGETVRLPSGHDFTIFQRNIHRV